MRLYLLLEHDLVRKPGPTFRDHALTHEPADFAEQCARKCVVAPAPFFFFSPRASGGATEGAPPAPSTSARAALSFSETRFDMALNSSMRAAIAPPCLRTSSASAWVSAASECATCTTASPVAWISAAVVLQVSTSWAALPRASG